METPISNYRLSKAEKELLKALGFGVESRGIRALMEIVREKIGIKEAKKYIKANQLGLKKHG